MSTQTVQLLIVFAAGGWLLAAMGTSFYASHLDYPAWPVFFCALALGFAIVLLVVTVAGGRRQEYPVRARLRDDDRATIRS